MDKIILKIMKNYGDDDGHWALVAVMWLQITTWRCVQRNSVIKQKIQQITIILLLLVFLLFLSLFLMLGMVMHFVRHFYYSNFPRWFVIFNTKIKLTTAKAAGKITTTDTTKIIPINTAKFSDKVTKWRLEK